MDMMEIRRNMMGVIAQMASGARTVKGTYYVGDDDAVINFGKSFSKYLFFVEMTDGSKTLLLNSGENGNRSFAICGAYPAPTVDGTTQATNVITYRVNPSTQAQSVNATSAFIASINESSIKLAKSNYFSGGVNYVYKGCTYKYYIVEMID